MKLGILDRITLMGLYSDASMYTLVDSMLEALVSDKEENEIWALNSLRTLGELRKKQREDGRDSTKSRIEYLDIVKKMIEELS